MKSAILLCLPLVLAGCEGFTYLDENYGSQPSQTISYKGENWSVRDDRTNQRLAITASSGRAVMEGALMGLSKAPGTTYRDAALEYLRASGRNCQSTSVTEVVDLTFEVSYLCR